MKKKQRGNLIQIFFELTKELKDSKIIRSERYLGDIGEYIAVKIFKLTLLKNQREEYIDGYIENKSVQVKFNSSSTKTNINVGKVKEYDFLILVLSKYSKHFPNNCKSDFVAYKLGKGEILNSFSKTKKNTYSCTKAKLSFYKYSQINYENLN